MSIVNLNDLLPPAPSGSLNVKWQWQLYPTGTNRYISAYVPEFIDSIQQERFTWAVDVGVADAYAVVLDPPPTIVPGSAVVFQVLNANTGPSTLSVNGTVYPLLKQGIFPLSVGDLFPGQVVVTVQDTLGNFQLVCEDRTRGSTGVVQLASSTGDFTPGNLASYGDLGDLGDSGIAPPTAGGFGSPVREVPIGVRNLSNRDFQLSFAPLEDWVVLHVNGDEQNPFRLYYLTPGTPNFTMAHPPKASDDFVAYYLRGIPNFGPPPPGVPPPPPPPVPLPPGSVSGCSDGVATYINGPGPGPHKWWRVDVTANETPGGWVPGNNAYGISCAELGLRAALGGSSVAVGGTAIESDNYPGLVAANAFDGDPSTLWGAAGPIFGSPPYLGWLGYGFASGVSIIEFAWTARSGIAGFQVPTACTLDWSDDGAHWTQGWGFTVPASCWVNAGSGGTLVFTTGGGVVLPPPTISATLTIWADFAGTDGALAVSYTEDAGLTWAGGDGTLPTDAGVVAPFPSVPFAIQAVAVPISPAPDTTKFRVRLFIAGTATVSGSNDVSRIYDIELNIGSTGYGGPQGSRVLGPEPGLQFGRVPAGHNLCEFGEYQRTATGSSYGSCPNFTKLVDTLLSNASVAFESFTYFPFSVAEQFNIKLHGGLTGYVATFFATAPRIAINIADPACQAYIFDDYVPNLLLPHCPTTRPVYVAIDGFSTNYSFVGAIVGSSFLIGGWDTGFPQNADEWEAGWVSFFAYAKTHAPEIRLTPHIGSMFGPTWDRFKTIYADCPAIEQEYFAISGGGPSSLGTQNFSLITNLSDFANVMPPVFAGDPPTRVLTWGTALDNGDLHSALGLYCQVRGPNTFFALLDAVGKYAIDPSLWVPTANKLGAATSAPTAVVGSGASSLLKRTFEGGIAYHNIGAGTQTIALPAGATNWEGQSIASITLANGKSDVVLVGTPVSVGVRPTRVAVVVGPDGSVANSTLSIDQDSNPPATAATIVRTDFSPTTVGSVLEVSWFGG